MTHLSKPGFAKPYRAQTACGLTAATADIVVESPECPVCHDVYLQDLVNQEAELAAFAREVEAA